MSQTAVGAESFTLFGVPICDSTQADAVTLIRNRLEGERGDATIVYFANAHTLNIACADPEFPAVLRRADYVFGDGTGVRWGARIIRGSPPRDNVNGTDLVPRMFRELAGQGLRYFLLGATPEMIEAAARYAEERFEGWELVGFHHGFILGYDQAQTSALLDAIRKSGADILLVGMGNPLQEKWIDAHREALDVKIAMAIGGQFAYWSGDLDRAPVWMRRLGIEWLHLMIRQPRKLARYMLGNPLFLLRVLAQRLGWRSEALHDPVAGS